LADLHLGKLFHDVSLTADQHYILEQIVAIARDHKVDVAAVSGDVYDRSVPPVQATVVMDEFLTRLIDLGIAVILTPGNHDSAERISFGSRLMRSRGLYIAPGLPGPIVPVQLNDDSGPVTFYPLPYIEPLLLKKNMNDADISDCDAALARVISDLPPCPGRLVCLAHCYTQGGEISESERPLTLGGSSQVAINHFTRFNLTLLGHLHRPQQVAPTVFYAGSPLKYSFSEAVQQKSVAIYDLAADGTFDREVFPLRPLHDVRRISGTFEQILAAAAGDAGREDYLWVELTDPGALFDYASKIREHYPNVLNITRTANQHDGVREGAIDIHGKSERDIVAAFFQHVTGADLTPVETALLDTIMSEILANPEGGAA
jgi:exonuclease SbcD